MRSLISGGSDRGRPPSSRTATALLMGAAVFNAVGNLAFHAIVARRGGAGGYGVVAAVLSFGTVASAVAAGAQFAIARRVAQRTDSMRRELLRSVGPLGMWIGVSVLLALASGPTASYLHLRQATAVLYAVCYFMVNIVQAVPMGALVGDRRFGWFAICIVVSVVVRLGIALPLGAAAATGAGAAGTSVVATLAASVLALVVAVSHDRVRDPGHGTPTPSSSWQLAFEGTGGALLGGCLWIVWVVPVVFARHYLSPSLAGRFGASQLIASGVLFLGGAVTTAFFPAVAVQKGRSALVSGLRTAAGVSAACVVGYVTLSPVVIRLLYGRAFVESMGVLLGLGVSVGLASISTSFLWLSRARQESTLTLSLGCLAAVAWEMASGLLLHGALSLAVEPAVAFLVGLAVVLIVRVGSAASDRRRRAGELPDRISARGAGPMSRPLHEGSSSTIA